jgi:hypothetical protein
VKLRRKSKKWNSERKVRSEDGNLKWEAKVWSKMWNWRRKWKREVEVEKVPVGGSRDEKLKRQAAPYIYYTTVSVKVLSTKNQGESTVGWFDGYCFSVGALDIFFYFKEILSWISQKNVLLPHAPKLLVMCERIVETVYYVLYALSSTNRSGAKKCDAHHGMH